MTRFQTLMSTLMNAPQRFENACIELLTQRAVNTAVGVQLDVLGKIVGQARLGLTDDVYRRYISARIATNRSTGKRGELLNIARLILGDSVGSVVIHTEGGAGLILEIQNRATDDATAAVLQNMLGSAVGSGIRLIVQWNNGTLAQTFRFDVGAGLDVGHLDGGLSNSSS